MALMEITIQVDQMAHRRNRRGVLLLLLAAILYLPAALLALYLLKAVLGRQTSGPYAGAVFPAGFVALLLIWLYGCRDSLLYRCPRCGRRLRQCIPESQPEPNIHYLCKDCRIVWDLGWGYVRGGGVGG